MSGGSLLGASKLSIQYTIINKINVVQAYRRGMKYPKYVFLMYGTYEPQWWTMENEASVGCSVQERAEVLEFSLAAAHFPSASLHEINGSENVKVFQNLIDKRRKLSLGYYPEYEIYHQCYDATIALALAINKTIAGMYTLSLLNY